jgi:hypothetical protein
MLILLLKGFLKGNKYLSYNLDVIKLIYNNRVAITFNNSLKIA